MKTCKLILYIVGVIIFIPVVINFICQTITPIKAIGDSTVWISFFGSYFGGIITSLITLFVLFTTMRKDEEKKEYEIHHEMYVQFCNDIGELCSSINIDRLAFLLATVKMTSYENLSVVFREISSIERDMLNAYNCFFVKYGHLPHNSKDEFVDQYLYYATTIRNNIDNILIAYSDIQSNSYGKNIMIAETPHFCEIASNCCKNLELLGDISTDLLKKAMKWKKEIWQKDDFLKSKYIKISIE